MKENIKLGITLLLFCLIAALSLAFTNEMTKGPIAELKAKRELEARKAVLPEADSFDMLDEAKLAELTAKNPIVQEVYIGKSGEEVVGYVVKSGPSGYGGVVVVITGVDLEGKVKGVRIGTNQETPGLGAKSMLPEFYEQYDGKTATAITVNKSTPSGDQIQAITAATITSKCVTRGVNASGEVASELGK